ncbi:transcription factor iiia [Coprinopsis sp. MPI-PUGE-AT-0042]|nr:transcription factor iiia [Coprinopsis sp. MPI-PUGE-AT-0042]
MATTLTVLGKRKAHVGTMRLVGSEPSCSEQSDYEKPILINGKLSAPTKRRYKCTYEGCDKAYTKPSRLEEHERTHTGERPFVCETCSKAYFRESHLHAHARSHLPESARPLGCDVEGCDKRFWTTQHLKVHQDWHNGAKPFQCTEDGCSEAFSKNHQLRLHVSQAHAAPGTKPFICDHEGCTKSFNTNQHLRAHKKTHDPNRYTCVHPTCLQNADETSNFFPTWSALQHHIRTEHPPTCSYPSCNGRTFASQKGLKAHLKLHEERDLEAELQGHAESDGEDEEEDINGRPAKKQRRGGEIGRDWKCTFEGCGKDFKSKKALTTHTNVTHLGKRDFKCTECGKAFGYKHLLQRHAAKLHTHNSSSEDEDHEESTGDDEADDAIDVLTGKAYDTQAQSALAQGKRFACPYPDVAGLTQEPLPGSSKACNHVFSRVYDLRRHLDSAHGINADKGALQEWMVKRRVL